MITTLEHRRQGFKNSSVSDNTNAPSNDRLQYPSTPKQFKSFDYLKVLQYDGNMLTPEERSELYKDHTKVIIEMAEAYVFSRCIYFNLKMSEKYQSNIETDRHIFAGRPTYVYKTGFSTGYSAVIFIQYIQTGTQ